MNSTNNAAQLIATSNVRIGQPLPVPVSIADRLKAVGLVFLAGTLGIGAVWLGRSLWHPHGEETLLPLSDDTSERAQPSLRDRVPVLRVRPEVSSPEADATLPSAKRRSRQSAQTASSRISYGFGNSDQSSNDAQKPATADPEADATVADGEVSDTDVPPIDPTLPVPIPPAPIAKAQVPEPAIAQVPVKPVPTPAKPLSPAFPVDLIAALLRSPPASQSPTTIAVTPRPAPLPPPATAPRPAPTPAIAPPPATDLPPETQPGQPTPRPSVVPQPSPTMAAIAPSTPRQDGIYVERLVIRGNTRFSFRELATLVQKTFATNATTPASQDPAFVNRRLTPAELVQASEAITKLYTGRGYINSGAFVPADVLTGATPEIRVVEGRLEKINVAVQPPGFLWLARPLSPNYVRRRLERGIQAPLQIDQLVDAVKLLEQDPLISNISTELAPGTTTGRSILNVKVQQATPLQVSLSIDNSRSPSVGRFQQQVSLSHTNLLGIGDRLQAGFNRTEGSRGWNLGYSLPINARNGTLSFNYSNNRGEVIEAPFQDLDINSRSQFYELALRQPIRQTATEVIALSLRGTHYSNKGVFLETFNDGVALPFPAQGSDADGRTRITTLRFGQDWTKRSDRSVFSLQSDFNFGINALNATVLDEPPDGRFFAWQGRGFWVRSLAPDTLFTLKGQVQLANRPLVPVEQISLGGLDTVRGYRTSTLLADSGWFASAEFYLPVLRVPKWGGVLQVIPFLDVGQGKNRGDDQPSPNRLLSTGLGLQWKMGDKFRARVDLGFPLINRTTESGRSLRESVFFSVTFTP
jgi:hemolysin activation/secretion protein